MVYDITNTLLDLIIEILVPYPVCVGFTPQVL